MRSTIETPLERSRDKFVAVAPAPHAAGRRRRKVRHAHERVRVAEAVEHLAAGLSGRTRVVIRPHAELGIFSLDRRGDHVTGDQRVLSPPADPPGGMVEGVAGRPAELDRPGASKIARYRLSPF